MTIRASEDEKDLRMEIRDNGPGIPNEALPHIFERFYRADPSRGKEVEGVGLGLSLVKWIVDQHGGRIDVSSGPSRGTTFVIYLPRNSSRRNIKHI